MKILEAQNAILTNVEVLHFFKERKASLAGPPKRRQPKALEDLQKDVIQFLIAPPGPLSQRPQPYQVSDISHLVERLHPYDLTKGEVVMILNLRPPTTAVLHACVEEIEERFTNDQQSEILGIIAEVLGEPPLQIRQDNNSDQDPMQSVEKTEP